MRLPVLNARPVTVNHGISGYMTFVTSSLDDIPLGLFAETPEGKQAAIDAALEYARRWIAEDPPLTSAEFDRAFTSVMDVRVMHVCGGVFAQIGVVEVDDREEETAPTYETLEGL